MRTFLAVTHWELTIQLHRVTTVRRVLLYVTALFCFHSTFHDIALELRTLSIGNLCNSYSVRFVARGGPGDATEGDLGSSLHEGTSIRGPGKIAKLDVT